MSSIEEKVIQKIRERAEVGKKKYGTTMDRKDLSTLDWLVHAQEEAMDLCVYLEKLIQEQDPLNMDPDWWIKKLRVGE